LSSAVAQQLSSKAAEQELASKLQLVEAKLSKTEAELAAVQKKVSLDNFNLWT
jgi:Streptococcal surface antigen repeat